jgi:hypothetical protein
VVFFAHHSHHFRHWQQQQPTHFPYCLGRQYACRGCKQRRGYFEQHVKNAAVPTHTLQHISFGTACFATVSKMKVKNEKFKIENVSVIVNVNKRPNASLFQ